MKRNLTLLLGCTLVLSACSFKKDDEVKPKVNEPVVVDVVEQIKSERAKEASNGQLTEENVQVTFAEAEMGFYNMTVSWPEDIPKVLVVINEKKEIVSGVSSVTVSVPQGTTMDIELTSHDSFGSSIAVFAISRRAPVDIEVSYPRYLNEDTVIEANRLYLLPDGYIETNGHHLSISVGKLTVEPKKYGSFIDNAKIRTQGAQNFGSNPFELRNSSITITAKKAIGTLSIAMIGFNGRHGRGGGEIELQNKVSRTRDTKLDGANGADEVIRRIPKTPDSPAQSVCSRPAGNGQGGAQGAAGTNGGDGQNGGDTGNLLVTIDDHSEFALEVGTKVGRPGKGGLGTAGHEGGNGGAPGRSMGICASSPQAGKKGANGPDGAHGKDGADGKVGTISSNVAKQKIFDLNITQSR